MPRDRFYTQALGTLHGRIKESRVLMVGAGGIGCELLKNLALTGFGEVHIVDLDTIDLSNLNRQFLFRHEHIKKSKALVAKESAARFNPNVKIEAYHANIKDPQFNVDWFKGFGIVFNALDNLDARRHVNKMCLAADVPLIESGTTGFSGQVQVIKKGKTECYDCNVKETPKSFPVCTIRSTPSQAIHCIVWAKSYLFTEIFGTSEDEAPELDHSEDSENAKEIMKLREETFALKRLRDSMGSEDFPRMVFDTVFKADVERLRNMEDMWKSRKAPEPLDFSVISEQALGVGKEIVHQDQRVWTVAENFVVFSDSLERLSDRLEETRANADVGNSIPILTFDKDDEDIMDFVASSANLRSIVFGIETRSRFDIKQMAGNIIPAIATTNAMIAALCVLQAFKVIRGDLNKARNVFLVKSTERVISSEPLRPPNPDCPICGVTQSRLIVDPNRATLNDLVQNLLRLELGYGEELSVHTDVGTIYDPDLEDNLPKKFIDLGVQADSFITVIDEEDNNPRVNVVFSVTEQVLPKESKPVLIPEKIEITRMSKKPTNGEIANGHKIAVTNGVSGKRKRDADDASLEDQQLRKRGRVAEEPSNGSTDLTGLDDPHGGAILIDD